MEAVKTPKPSLVQSTVAHHIDVSQRFFDQCEPELIRLGQTCAQALENHNKVLLAGNGGSAADAQHIAAEFVGRFVNDRRALPSIALTTDTSILTAVGNDYGYDQVFSRQIEGLGQKGDIFIGITTSGNSDNILKALEAAKAKGLTTVTLMGKTGGSAKGLADFEFIVPDSTTAQIQECHIMFLHLLCALVEQEMKIS